MKSRFLTGALILLLPVNPAAAQEEPPKLYSLLSRIDRADVVCAGRVEAVRPTTTFIYPYAVRHRKILVDVTIDTVFKGQLDHDFLTLAFYRWAPESGGYAGSGPPRHTYREGRRYLLFLRRELPAVFVPLHPTRRTEIELVPIPAAKSLASEHDDASRRLAIAEEFMARLRMFPAQAYVGDNYVMWLEELLDTEAEPFLRELLDHPNSQLQVEAAETLVRRALPVSPQMLLNLLADQQKPYWARGRVARLLGELKIGQARILLERIALEETEMQLRQDALYALRELADLRSVPNLIQLLEDPSEDIRTWAVGVLLTIATGKVLALDIIQAHQVEIIPALKRWAEGGLPPNVERFLQ